MTKKNTAIQGDLSVSVGISVGGNSNTKGDATIEHNLKVKGWITARNIIGPLKGLFSSEETLNSSYPKPENGWFALVGNRLPARLYRVENKEWKDTGEQSGEIEPYLDDLENGVSENRTAITKLQEDKQENLTFDNVPTSGSNNPVTSNGIKQALNSQKSEVDAAKDSALSAISNSESNAIANFNAQRITPEMLSESTKQLIEAAGGGTINNLPDDEDLTSKDIDGAQVLKFNDKRYNKTNFSGLGRKYLRKNIQDGKNILTQDMLSDGNTIYIIQYDYDLNGIEINVPDSCVLQFDGGSLSNGILLIGNSIIKSPLRRIFSDLKIYESKISNGFKKTNHTLYVEWFGAIGDGTTDDTQAINDCATYANKRIEFQTRSYYITDTITISSLEVKTNNCCFISNIKRKFALVTNNPNSNVDGFLHIIGGLTLCNINTDFTEITKSFTFNGTTINLASVESITGSQTKVVYQDFTVDGCDVGDIVLINHEDIDRGYIELSGEVIDTNTVRVYANNYGYMDKNIDNVDFELKILSGVSHGLNAGGYIYSFNMIRLIKYTGLSCGIGNGVDAICGIRYPAKNKTYYSHLEINTFASGGISFSCPNSNNCNSFKIISFSGPYSTTAGWPKTYPYHSCVISGINNHYELLSIEGIYHKEAIIIRGTGNYCNNVYTEFPNYEEFPSTRTSICSKVYSNGNNFRITFGSYIKQSLLHGNNNIYNDFINSFNGNKTFYANNSCNLLSNFSFKYGKYNWNDYTTGNNKSIEFVEGPLPNTIACKMYTENGRIALAQSINLNEDSIKNTFISISCWVKGNIKGSIYINNNNVFVTSSLDEQNENWHYLQTTLNLDLSTNTSIDVQFRGEDNKTGYIEWYNPCVSYGVNTENISLVDNTIYTDKKGVLFNNGNAIAPNETYYEDIVLDWIKQESMINFRWRVPDKIDFLTKFKLEYVISDGFIRMYLTNITDTNQYSGRIYPYIQVI